MLNRFSTLAVSTVLGVFLHSTLLFAQTGAPATKPNFTAHLIVGGADKTDPALAWLRLKVRLGRGWGTGGEQAVPALPLNSSVEAFSERR